MTGLPEAASAHIGASPLEAFRGTFPRTKTGTLYSAGLGIVAFGMVLLPLMYFALILFTSWLVLLHLKNDTWIFSGGSGNVLIRLILYFGPAVAGGILVFFMIKPFFAAKNKAPEPVTLDPVREPLLFAFVQKICTLVGAPAPCRINVDCQVNASASLRRGIWSKDLVLTIGLPLASGLTMREFAGVLAHEFGHFAQGAGMRLTYIIRKLNFWFARVVYERDAWDHKLDRSAQTVDWRFRVVLHAARGCVWLSRRILWALMHAGNAISCFMLRQMEYDADSYEAKLAGSDAFETTAAQLRLINVAAQSAYEDVRQSWASHRLPEDLPLLIGHKAGSLPAEIHQKLVASAASQKTRWFDTHPCDADRVRAVRRLNEPGVFQLTQPATSLFCDFAALSKTVTRHQYEKHFQLEFSDQNLMSAQEIVRESTASAEAEAMVRKYYGSVNISLKPLLVTELPLVADGENALEKWREARQTTESLRPDAEKLSAEWLTQQTCLISLTSAQALSKAGFKLEPKEFGLGEDATSPADQESAARIAIEETTAALSERFTNLEPFIAALRQRIVLALGLVPADRTELTELARLLVAVGAEMPRVHEIGSKLNALRLLAQNRGNHSKPFQVDSVMAELSTELQTVVGGIQARLKDFAYPFPHARGPLTVGEYARYEKHVDNELERTYLDAKAHLDRLFPLHYRLLGRVLALGDAAETKLHQS